MVRITQIFGEKNRLGWGVSIGVHFLLAVGFFLCSGSGQESDERAVVKGYLIEPVEALAVEPVVEDLRIEPLVGLDRIDAVAPLAMPEVVPVALGVADDAIGVVGGGESGFVVSGGAVSRPGTFSQRFCGIKGEARRICYVVDCSGSMVVAIEYVRQQLRASLGQLSPAQYFQVVFYSGAEPVTMEQGKLLRATRQNVGRALTFVDDMKLGRTDGVGAAATAVVAALAEAFGSQSAEGEGADLIYLLTDGEFDQAVVVRACGELRKQNLTSAVVHVVGCGNSENKIGLKKLARKNRGQFRFVGVEQLDAAIRTRRGR
jgi:hypothetical protein